MAQQKCVKFADEVDAPSSPRERQPQEQQSPRRRRSWDNSFSPASLPTRLSPPEMPKRQLSRTIFAIDDLVLDEDHDSISYEEQEAADAVFVACSRSWSSGFDYTSEEQPKDSQLRSRGGTERSLLCPPTKPERKTSLQCEMGTLSEEEDDDEVSAPSSTRSLPERGINSKKQTKDTKKSKGAKTKSRGSKRGSSKMTINSGREAKRFSLGAIAEDEQSEQNIVFRTLALLPIKPFKVV